MDKKNKDIIKKTLIGLFITIAIYFFVGNFFNYIGMTIYAVKGNYNLYSDKLEPEIYFQNNAPMTLPFINSLFYYGVATIYNESLCKDLNCISANIYDIKKVEAGESEKLSISISPNDNQNFSFVIYSYLNTFNMHLFSKSKKISCSLNGSNPSYSSVYTCEG